MHSVLGSILLFAGIASLIVSVATARRAWRSHIRHRWWWTFVCLVCAPVMTYDGRTGRVSTSVLSASLFGLGVGTNPNGGWVQFAPPLGALLFLQRRRALIAAACQARSDADVSGVEVDSGKD